MKRLFITTFLIITVPFLIFSQNTYIGIRGGLNASWFGGDNWDDYISKSENYFGISISESAAEYATFGLFIENMFSKNIGIASSISYTTYGQDYKYSYSGYRFKGEFSQKAIEILPLLKFSTNYNQGIYALLGPSIQYLVEDFEFE